MIWMNVIICMVWADMSSQTTHTMPFTQIIAFKSHLDNLGKPLNSTLSTYNKTSYAMLRNLLLYKDTFFVAHFSLLACILCVLRLLIYINKITQSRPGDLTRNITVTVAFITSKYCTHSIFEQEQTSHLYVILH